MGAQHVVRVELAAAFQVATRERRSANSQDARSMMASARREVTISSSMVSSGTSVSATRPPAAAGRRGARPHGPRVQQPGAGR
jgi:hypothetical protein